MAETRIDISVGTVASGNPELGWVSWQMTPEDRAILEKMPEPLRTAVSTVAAGLATSVLIAVRHRDNIRRLRFGTEPRIGVARQSSVDSGVA